MASDPPARAARAWPWLFALAGCAFDVAAFWPGQMSFDSAQAWALARAGDGNGIVPQGFVWLWRIGGELQHGPGALFALQLVLFWGGLALLAGALRLGPRTAAAIMLVCGFAPVPLVLHAHVWTDVMFASTLVALTGALAWAGRSGRRHWLLPATALLALAAGVRHNALPALLPFAFWEAALLTAGWHRWPRRRTVAAAGVALLALLAALTQAVDATAPRRVPVWPSLAQFDLAAVSIASGEMRLPAFMTGPGLDVADLADAFRSWSNVPMLTRTRHGLRAPFDAYTPAQRVELRRAWFAAIRDEPGAWLAHRARVTAALFGTHAPDWPRELVYVDAETGYGDNPPVARNATALHEVVMRVAAATVATPLLAAWPCLALGLVAAPLAWRRRRDPRARAAGIALASAALYAAPLAVIAPAAELRYLDWPCVASLLAFVLALCARQSPIPARGADRR